MNAQITRQNTVLQCGQAINGAPAVPCVPNAVWNGCLATALSVQAKASAMAQSSTLSAAVAASCGYGDFTGTSFGYGGGINDAAAHSHVAAPGCVSTNGSTPQFAAVWGLSPSGYGYLLMVCAG